MKNFLLLLLISLASLATAQDKPSYCCDELPQLYEKEGRRPALPKFNTTPTVEYKVQVAILKRTNPGEYPFHSSLIATYRPCEQVWVVESRQSFLNKKDAENLKVKLQKLGYSGAYLTEIITYQ